MIFWYIRVSSNDQNPERQFEAIKEFEKEIENDNIYLDKQTGKDFNREKYQELKSVLREGDTLIIKELDRLVRNKEMIKSELSFLKNEGIRIKILNIPTTLMDLPEENAWVIEMVNNILIKVLGAIATWNSFAISISVIEISSVNWFSPSFRMYKNFYSQAFPM